MDLLLSHFIITDLSPTQVTDRLAEFRELVKEVVRRACANALFEAGFPLEESGSGFGSPDPGMDSYFTCNMLPV